MLKRVSLKDIAEKVGVSTALVSYVLNDKKTNRINKDVAANIKAVALELNYKPNLVARSLRTNRTNTIGLIVSDISNPFFSSVARMIENEAFKYNYTVIFGSSDEQNTKLERLINVLQERQVDGFIIVPVDNSLMAMLDLKKQKIPLVLIDRHFENIDINTVVIDNKKAAYQATKHLIESGRKRIAMIGFHSALLNLNDRREGYRSALKASGIKPDPKLINQVRMLHVQEDVEKAIDHLIELVEPIDGILFGSNSISTFALKCLNKYKIKIPSQVSLVAIDETETSELFYAPLTCMRQPISDIARLAVETLMHQVQDLPKNRKAVHHVLDAELIVRKSSSK